MKLHAVVSVLVMFKAESGMNTADQEANKCALLMHLATWYYISTCHNLFVYIMVALTKAHHMLLHVAIIVNLIENPRFSEESLHMGQV
jgi:hypothetical protein